MKELKPIIKFRSFEMYVTSTLRGYVKIYFNTKKYHWSWAKKDMYWLGNRQTKLEAWLTWLGFQRFKKESNG